MLRNPEITSGNILGSDVCSLLALAVTVLKLAPSCDSLPLEAFMVLCLLASVCDEVFMIRWAHSLHSNHFHRGHLLGMEQNTAAYNIDTTHSPAALLLSRWVAASCTPQLQERLASNLPGGKSKPLCPSPPQHTTHTKHVVHTQHPTLYSIHSNSWIVTIDHHIQNL